MNVIIGLIFLFFSPQKNVINGVVKDAESLKPLPYVRIGVKLMDVGTISNEEGEFTIDLSKVETNKYVTFQGVGYEPRSIKIEDLKESDLVIVLQKDSLINSKLSDTGLKGRKKNIGIKNITKYTFGFSGMKLNLKGAEKAIRIPVEGKYLVEKVKIHMKDNTPDSILLRFNLYNIINDEPGQIINKSEWFAKGYRGDKWVVKDVSMEQFVLQDEVIISMELVDVWYSEKKENKMFFSLDVEDKQTVTYSRNSYLDEWVNGRGNPLCIQLEGKALDIDENVISNK